MWNQTQIYFKQAIGELIEKSLDEYFLPLFFLVLQALQLKLFDNFF